MSKYAAVYPLFAVVGGGILLSFGAGVRTLATHNDVVLDKRTQWGFEHKDGVRLVPREQAQKSLEKLYFSK